MVRKSERGAIDPYGLGFVVILFGALFGGIQHSGENQEQDNIKQVAVQNPATSEQEPGHASGK